MPIACSRTYTAKANPKPLTPLFSLLSCIALCSEFDKYVSFRMDEIGYVMPTDIQREALPYLFSGLDCILHAQVIFILHLCVCFIFYLLQVLISYLDRFWEDTHIPAFDPFHHQCCKIFRASPSSGTHPGTWHASKNVYELLCMMS